MQRLHFAPWLVAHDLGIAGKPHPARHPPKRWTRRCQGWSTCRWKPPPRWKNSSTPTTWWDSWRRTKGQCQKCPGRWWSEKWANKRSAPAVVFHPSECPASSAVPPGMRIPTAWPRPGRCYLTNTKWSINTRPPVSPPFPVSHHPPKKETEGPWSTWPVLCRSPVAAPGVQSMHSAPRSKSRHIASQPLLQAAGGQWQWQKLWRRFAPSFLQEIVRIRSIKWRFMASEFTARARLTTVQYPQFVSSGISMAYISRSNNKCVISNKLRSHKSGEHSFQSPLTPLEKALNVLWGHSILDMVRICIESVVE